MAIFWSFLGSGLLVFLVAMAYNGVPQYIAYLRAKQEQESAVEIQRLKTEEAAHRADEARERRLLAERGSSDPQERSGE